MSDQENPDQSTPEAGEGGVSSADAPGSAETPPPPPPPSASADGDGESGGDNKGLMLVLSYLWILALIPLLVEKDDAEVQWHAKNGLVWTIAEFLMHVVLTVFSMVTAFVGCFVGPLLMVAWLIVRIMGIMKALNGERLRLPVLADFVEKF